MRQKKKYTLQQSHSSFCSESTHLRHRLHRHKSLFYCSFHPVCPKADTTLTVTPLLSLQCGDDDDGREAAKKTCHVCLFVGVCSCMCEHFLCPLFSSHPASCSVQHKLLTNPLLRFMLLLRIVTFCTKRTGVSFLLNVRFSNTTPHTAHCDSSHTLTA